MASARRTVSRGALLLALMSGSGALAGGVAHADTLGGALPLPDPGTLSVPLVGPSPSPSATPADSGTGTTAPADTTSTGGGDATTADTSDASTPQDGVVAASDSAPAPVSEPVAGPVAPAGSTSTARTAGGATLSAPTGARQLPPSASAGTALAAGTASTAGSTTAGSTTAADGPAVTGADRFALASGFPALSSASLQLPALPELDRLAPKVAAGPAETPTLARNGAPAYGGISVVRTGRSTPVQPGSPAGVVLFVMASAAGAAGLARVRIWRRSALS